MRKPVFAAVLVAVALAGAVHAEVVHVPLKSNVVLNPNQAYTLNIDAATPTEIGWITPKKCSSDCIQMTDITNPRGMGVTTSLGAAKKFEPANGKISAEFKNVSAAPVTITVYRVQRTCHAESCRFIDKNVKPRFLAYKIATFKSITTSKDESYSVISGTALSGRPFTVHAIWWSEDPKGIRFGCAKWIKGWIENHASPEQYSPYVLTGMATGEGNNIVLNSIDTCVPKAPHYGVDENKVFK